MCIKEQLFLSFFLPQLDLQGGFLCLMRHLQIKFLLCFSVRDTSSSWDSAIDTVVFGVSPHLHQQWESVISLHPKSA